MNRRPTDYESVALPSELRWPFAVLAGNLNPKRAKVYTRLLIRFKLSLASARLFWRKAPPAKILRNLVEFIFGQSLSSAKVEQAKRLLQFNNKTIVRHFKGDLAAAVQNFLSQMRQQNSFCAETSAVFHDPWIVKMSVAS